VVAFYLSRHGTRRLPLMEAGIAKHLGVSEGSLARRQANFAHLLAGPAYLMRPNCPDAFISNT